MYNELTTLHGLYQIYLHQSLNITTPPTLFCLLSHALYCNCHQYRLYILNTCYRHTGNDVMPIWRSARRIMHSRQTDACMKGNYATTLRFFVCISCEITASLGKSSRASAPLPPSKLNKTQLCPIIHVAGQQPSDLCNRILL